MTSRSVRRSAAESVPMVRTTRPCSMVENRFQYGRLDQPGRLPVGDERFTKTGRLPHLAGNRHDDEIAAAGVIAAAGHDDGGPLLGARLVGER